MSSKIGLDIIEKIKSFRRQGQSLPEISRELNISKTSVHRYIKGVEILPKYRSEWIGKRGGSKNRKRLKELNALMEGEKLVGTLTYKEKLLFLCALYWAEGNKKDFIFTNTDSNLIKTFVNYTRDVLSVHDNDLRISIRVYEDLDKEKCLDFWSNIVNISKEKFLKTYILSGKKKGKLEFGMCRVRVVKGGDLLKRVMGINRAVVSTFKEELQN